MKTYNLSKKEINFVALNLLSVLKEQLENEDE